MQWWQMIEMNIPFCFTVTEFAADGLKYYDIVEGNGPVAEKGSTVQVGWFFLEIQIELVHNVFGSEFIFTQVHFDCMYRGITAVSSRESKLLSGNRSIAQVMFIFS